MEQRALAMKYLLHTVGTFDCMHIDIYIYFSLRRRRPFNVVNFTRKDWGSLPPSGHGSSAIRVPRAISFSLLFHPLFLPSTSSLSLLHLYSFIELELPFIRRYYNPTPSANFAPSCNFPSSSVSLLTSHSRVGHSQPCELSPFSLILPHFYCSPQHSIPLFDMYT